MDPSERDHPDDDRHQTRGGEGQLAPLASRDEGTKTPLLSEPGNPFFTLARPASSCDSNAHFLVVIL